MPCFDTADTDTYADVVANGDGVQDIVKDSRTGFLVRENKEEFAEAVQKIIDDEGLRKKFGEEAGRIAREKYTSKVCAKKMLEVYEQVLKTKDQISKTKNTD